jgi:Mn2+/Fe2+ NRAMP family transporter
MLDDDDLNFAFLVSPPGLIGVVIIVIVLVIVLSNKKECSQKHCEQGKPVLVENACRCLTDAE